MNKNGFTIIEVMIFLAISGVMFIAGLNSLLNTQQKDQFSVVVGLIKSEIQNTILKAGEGNYNLPSSYECLSGSGSRLAIVRSSSITNNPDCMDIGTAFLLTNNPATLNILPVFGFTFSNNGIATKSGSINGSAQPNSTSLAQALPITSSYLNNPYPISTVVNVSKLGFYDSSGTFQPINGFLIFNNFNQYSSTTSLLSTGAQFSEDVPILPDGSATLSSEINAVNQITDSADCLGNSTSDIYACQVNATTGKEILFPLSSQSPINPANGIELCLQDQGDNESDLITIGGNQVNNLKTVVNQLYNNNYCGIKS